MDYRNLTNSIGGVLVVSVRNRRAVVGADPTPGRP
jgi:hypothetical protein